MSANWEKLYQYEAALSDALWKKKELERQPVKAGQELPPPPQQAQHVDALLVLDSTISDSYDAWVQESAQILGVEEHADILREGQEFAKLPAADAEAAHSRAQCVLSGEVDRWMVSSRLHSAKWPALLSWGFLQRFTLCLLFFMLSELLAWAGWPAYTMETWGSLMPAWVCLWCAALAALCIVAFMPFEIPPEAMAAIAALVMFIALINALQTLPQVHQMYFQHDWEQRGNDIDKLRRLMKEAWELLQSPALRDLPRLSHLVRTLHARLQATLRLAERAKDRSRR